MISKKKLQRIESKWKRALLTSNEGDWLQSEVAVEVWSVAQGDDELAYAILVEIGVTAGGTKSKLGSMAEARKIVPDRDVWLAAGWGGVRRLARMSKSERKKRVAGLRKEIAKGTKPKAAAARILPKPKQKSKSGKGRASQPAPQHTPNRVQATLLDAVLADLVKLARFNPAMLDLVSDATREAIEARMKGAA